MLLLGLYGYLVVIVVELDTAECTAQEHGLRGRTAGAPGKGA